jgi:hypothetical protein
VIPLVVDLPRRTRVKIPSVAPSSLSTVVLLPIVLHELAAIQRHILARVAVHTWTHGGSIPFVPPNTHQATVAASLAAPEVRLLVLTASCPASFSLSRLGEYVARRMLCLVPWEVDQTREIEFDRMRALMRNDWEIGFD